MKVWMEYEFGYINIDDEFIYFSDSGNWGSVKKLDEAEQIGSVFSIGRVISFAIIVVAIAGFKGFLFASISAAIFGAFGIYSKMSQTFKKDIGHQFKVPISKILEVSWEDDEIEFWFLNRSNSKEVFRATGVDSSNFVHFNQLSELISKN